MVNHKRYITRKRARIEGICGKVNIPYGTALETEDGYLLYDGSRLCVVTSQNAYDYFSQDDDGHGLERGGLDRKIEIIIRGVAAGLPPSATDTGGKSASGGDVSGRR